MYNAVLKSYFLRNVFIVTYYYFSRNLASLYMPDRFFDSSYSIGDTQLLSTYLLTQLLFSHPRNSKIYEKLVYFLWCYDNFFFRLKVIIFDGETFLIENSYLQQIKWTLVVLLEDSRLDFLNWNKNFVTGIFLCVSNKFWQRKNSFHFMRFSFLMFQFG